MVGYYEPPMGWIDVPQDHVAATLMVNFVAEVAESADDIGT
jgi:hypothetical protein